MSACSKCLNDEDDLIYDGTYVYVCVRVLSYYDSFAVKLSAVFQTALWQWCEVFFFLFSLTEKIARLGCVFLPQVPSQTPNTSQCLLSIALVHKLNSAIIIDRRGKSPEHSRPFTVTSLMHTSIQHISMTCLNLTYMYIKLAYIYIYGILQQSTHVTEPIHLRLGLSFSFESASLSLVVSLSYFPLFVPSSIHYP